MITDSECTDKNRSVGVGKKKNALIWSRTVRDLCEKSLGDERKTLSGAVLLCSESIFRYNAVACPWCGTRPPSVFLCNFVFFTAKWNTFCMENRTRGANSVWRLFISLTRVVINFSSSPCEFRLNYRKPEDSRRVFRR